MIVGELSIVGFNLLIVRLGSYEKLPTSHHGEAGAPVMEILGGQVYNFHFFPELEARAQDMDNEICNIPKLRSKWDERLLEIEERLLLKELQHLRQKESERGLNSWERGRKEELPVEIQRVQSGAFSALLI